MLIKYHQESKDIFTPCNICFYKPHRTWRTMGQFPSPRVTKQEAHRLKVKMCFPVSTDFQEGRVGCRGSKRRLGAGVASLQDLLQWPCFQVFTPMGSPLYQPWSVWPKVYSRKHGMSLPGGGYERLQLLSQVLSTPTPNLSSLALGKQAASSEPPSGEACLVRNWSLQPPGGKTWGLSTTAWVSLEADFLGPINPWDDLSSSQPLDCNLVRHSEPEIVWDNTWLLF